MRSHKRTGAVEFALKKKQQLQKVKGQGRGREQILLVFTSRISVENRHGFEQWIEICFSALQIFSTTRIQIRSFSPFHSRFFPFDFVCYVWFPRNWCKIVKFQTSGKKNVIPRFCIALFFFVSLAVTLGFAESVQCSVLTEFLIIF